jgi:phage repressor protein C with HTH and peptisase S24 domain
VTKDQAKERKKDERKENASRIGQVIANKEHTKKKRVPYAIKEIKAKIKILRESDKTNQPTNSSSAQKQTNETPVRTEQIVKTNTVC